MLYTFKNLQANATKLKLKYPVTGYNKYTVYSDQFSVIHS